MSDIATGRDADFDEERLVQLYNTSLGNRIGNLLNRVLPFFHRHRAGTLRGSPGYLLIDQSEKPGGIASYRKYMDENDIGMALEDLAANATYANQLVEQKAPWQLIKTGALAEVDAVLYTVAESLRIIAILISPVLPNAAHGIFDQLNWKMELSGKEERFSLADVKWGRLPDGHVVGKPVPLFPRIEISD